MRVVHEAVLPKGYTMRRATADDAEIIFEVQAAHEVPIIGRPNATLDDVRDELVEPDFDLDADGFLIFGPLAVATTETGPAGAAVRPDTAPAAVASRAAVGWGWACRKGDSDNVDIAMYVRPGHEAIAGWLLDAVLARTVEIGRELDHHRVVVDFGAYPADKLVTGLLRASGFEPATRFNRMRIDHVPSPAFPDVPDGVELRHGTDVQVRKDAIAVRNDAFSDHFGFVSRTFEQWAADREASSSHDWALVHVAYLDGVPAAVLVRTNNFVPDENCGYVLTLGTAHERQGRGLGGYLLKYAFAADAAAGRVGTVLHVDTNPQRPALGLYQRNGMRSVLVIDVWRRSLPT
jgi:GNAT superfamily N-acetyltransferase